MISLHAPDERFHASFIEAHYEFRGEFRNAGGSWSAPPCESGYPGISFSLKEMQSPEGFARYCEWQRDDAHDAAPRPVVQVPTTHLWIVEGDEFLGSIHLRHWLTDFLQDMGGHISYSVRPSVRGRGVASEALRLAVPVAAQLGLSRVLITCSTANEGSARVIENNGGVLEGVRRGMRRYWLETSEVPAEPVEHHDDTLVHTPIYDAHIAEQVAALEAAEQALAAAQKAVEEARRAIADAVSVVVPDTPAGLAE